MDTELAALAASGATTLVSLMVTDSWAQARELVGRLISRNDPGGAAVADLDTTRDRLLAADAYDGAVTAQDITDHWHAQFHELLRNGSVTSGGLRDLVTVLQRLADTSAPLPLTVRNDITGGVQHGPVIQAGRITGLTFRDRGPDTPEGGG
ncbi:MULTISPECIES: hypothetical protein [unclassified Streptomyces]|uniref:Uncharacterized protein n=1 Tax=Streptomyces sp. gb1(2016) TaxID=1828321 RepID=A0A652LDR3_9ACTN|nr:hypothetical protein [Streptomyces sp. gb1(2016)]TXS33891.1 hypothetical protein EAO74_02050 [Streptomyces sp. gb1(2016)]